MRSSFSVIISILLLFYCNKAFATPDGVTIEMKILDQPLLLREKSIAYVIKNNSEKDYSFSEHWLMNSNVYIEVRDEKNNIILNDVGGYFEEGKPTITISPGTSVILLGLPPSNMIFNMKNPQNYKIIHKKFEASISIKPGD